MLTFAEACRAQHQRHSYYTVWLISPDGQREYLGSTQRRSGQGLIKVLQREDVQERVKQFPNAEALRFTKTATALFVSNGYRVAFGGTIRQEAQDDLPRPYGQLHPDEETASA